MFFYLLQKTAVSKPQLLHAPLRTRRSEPNMDTRVSLSIPACQRKTTWRRRLQMGPKENPTHHSLDRTQQVAIFRLRTGHCQLLALLFRLKISHTDECPCGTGQQTPSPVLKSCPTFDSLRRQAWPSATDFHEKLWESAGSLRRSADVALQTGLVMRYSAPWTWQISCRH